MATEEITVTPYNGSLLATDLLSTSKNLVLTDFGSPETGTLEDNDGLLEVADNGTSTFNGEPLIYIGSGLATPGTSVLGVLVAVGPSVPVSVFSVGGQIYFHFPEGEPNLLGALLLNVDITSAPSQIFTPICFARDTLIRTPQGDLPIQDIGVGDTVMDHEGIAHRVIWRGARQLNLPVSPTFDKWRPVRIESHAFGEGKPYRVTRLSQQHRVLLQGWKAELYAGEPEILAPAVGLVNDSSIILDHAASQVEYHHLMCSGHVVLVANGLPAESLFPGIGALEGLTSAGRAEVLGLFPELATGTEPYRIARPVLPAWAGRLFN